ncbi:hypothetical protein MLD38_022292 [Melastoma candidum]|uniref:Uncharacterized protein n=1 Tax=Melastoma candidum TaxID=119954 RepID=A0ACB9QJB9_9MYRT|nr:hypothetical protein MLD38_022292 [Melastoma candidum]
MDIGAAAAVAGFVADTVAGELLQNLIEISTRVVFCRGSAEDLKDTVDVLIPIIAEIRGSGVDVPEPRRSHFDQVSRLLQEGLDVTRQILGSPRYSLFRRLQLTRKMDKLEKDISKFNKFIIQASILAEVSHMRSEGAESFHRLEESNRQIESSLVEIIRSSGIRMAVSRTEVQEDAADGWGSDSRREQGSVAEGYPVEEAWIAGGHVGERERDGDGCAEEEAEWGISGCGGEGGWVIDDHRWLPSLSQFFFNMGILRREKKGPRPEALRGGNRAALFIYATVGLENMAFITNAVSLVTYFYGYMNFGLTKSATTLTNFMGASYMLALFGGFLSDTYLSRFKTCIIFGCTELMGYTLLTIQAHFHQLRPVPCKTVALRDSNQCEPASGIHTAILFIGLYLVALGTSGVKAALPSLGADQFDSKDPEETANLSSFFNWLVFSVTIGAMIGVTFVVWIGSNRGWEWSFGICTVAVMFAVAFVSMGRSLYRHNVPKGSPIMRILQVFVVAFKNRSLPLPSKTDELHEIYDDEEDHEKEHLQRTDQFRFLDRAAIIRCPTVPDMAMAKSTTWNQCTVTQVEETKILVRMLPIILSTVFMNTCLAQLQTFSIQQSTTMDPHLGGLKVPSASVPIIPLIFMFILIPLYDRGFVPLARKLTGIPTGIRHLQRVGFGLVLSIISMTVAGFVETRRKSVAVKHNMVDSAEPLPMSMFWLGFQFSIFGAADLFTIVGMLEFFYSESSAGMKSLSTAISWCSMAFGYFMSSVVVKVVNKASGGWLGSNNLNKDKLNYFYWLLAGLGVVNFGFYLVCASWYKYKEDDAKQLEVPSQSSSSTRNLDKIVI